MQPTEESFLADVSRHQMMVLRDDGAYRHLVFCRPDSRALRFELITWPGTLCYTGDMGTYVFARERDMLQFFRGPGHTGKLEVNPPYWAEKAQAADLDGIRCYEPELFREAVRAAVSEAHTGIPPSPELLAAVEWEVLDKADDGAYAAMQAAVEFTFEGESVLRDFWETNVEGYTFRFLWCCFALAWAVRQYDTRTVRAA